MSNTATRNDSQACFPRTPGHFAVIGGVLFVFSWAAFVVASAWNDGLVGGVLGLVWFVITLAAIAYMCAGGIWATWRALSWLSIPLVGLSIAAAMILPYSIVLFIMAASTHE